MELLVVLVLLGILSGVVGLTLRTARRVPTVSPTLARIAAARDSAIRSGHPVSVVLRDGEQLARATAYPDGHVIADPILGIDPATGEARDAAR